jgi:beta-lactamase superfamily II metal-dependent hydrolase
MRSRSHFLIFAILLSIIHCARFVNALQPEPNAVFARVIDSGAALSIAVVTPDNHFMIYDAGNYVGGGSLTFKAIKELIPEGSTIDLMVLSHSDSDHLGAVDEICDAYHVKRIIHSGYQRDSQTWKDAAKAILLEKETDGCIDINLKDVEFPPGATYRFGDIFVTMVAGWHKPPSEWGLSEGSAEYKNAGSIVIRLQFKDKSVLLTGDTVGRHIGDPESTCIAAEKYMVEGASVIKIDSDVLVAPHHGADNASSLDFIRAVSPEYVIFSAGHKFHHPRASTANRYLSTGIPKERMSRTDRGDDEGSEEWEYGRVPGNVDPAGDDDVDILIRPNGSIVVDYRNP